EHIRRFDGHHGPHGRVPTCPRYDPPFLVPLRPPGAESRDHAITTPLGRSTLPRTPRLPAPPGPPPARGGPPHPSTVAHSVHLVFHRAPRAGLWRRTRSVLH